MANCHIDRKHKAHGLCQPCYDSQRNKTPEARIKQRQQYKKRLAYHAEYDAKPEQKLKKRLWHNNNKGHSASITARYRARKDQRTPKWADLEKIKQIYINCPKGMAVDHIVPLRGEIVSGLHVHNNLQYLPIEENCKKRNKF